MEPLGPLRPAASCGSPPVSVGGGGQAGGGRAAGEGVGCRVNHW
jgi:hypothetical protein